MAKKKGGKSGASAKPSSGTEQVRLPSTLCRQGRTIASHRGVKLTAYFTHLLRPLVEADLAVTVRQLGDVEQED